MKALREFWNRHFEGLLLSGVALIVLGNVVSMATTGTDLISVGAPLVLGAVVLGLMAFGAVAVVLLLFSFLR